MRELTCSFCGKPESQVMKLIHHAVKDVSICDECIVEKLDDLGATTEFSEFQRKRFQKMAFELRKMLFPL